MVLQGELSKSVELANLPLDRKGLHEFGMGMKVSSIWLCNTWTVETSAFGEPIRKTMTFDLEEVVAKEEFRTSCRGGSMRCQ